MSAKRIVAVAAVAAAAAVLLALFFPTRERQVKKRFKALESWVRLEEPEPPLAVAGKFREAETFFADPFELEASAYEYAGSFTPRDIAGHAARWRTRFKKLDLEFYDLHITFYGDTEAQATATAHLSGAPAGGDPFDETHEVECTLRKGEDGWRFSKMTVVQVLER